MEYVLVRSDRKTVSLFVNDDGKLEIRAPKWLPISDIEKLIDEKSTWIERNMELKKQQLVKKTSFSVYYGSEQLLLGRKYPILETESKSSFNGEFFLIRAGLDKTHVKNEMIQLYKHLAARIIFPKVEHYAVQMSVMPTAIHINGAKSRWGSCSAKNCLNFSWRLSLGNEDIVDYVVVHELAHIIHHDHSKEFWKVVESVIPDYIVRKAELRKLGLLLAEQDW